MLPLLPLLLLLLLHACAAHPAVVLFKPKLFVFAEGRWSNGDGCQVPKANVDADVDDDVNGDLDKAGVGDPACKGYYRAIFFRVSEDEGATFGPIRRLAGDNASCNTDPGPAYDPVTGKLVVQYSASGGAELWQATSTDLGDTFTFEKLSDKTVAPALSVPVSAGITRPGPAGGVRLSTGRIMYAGYGTAGVSVWFSDDVGATWQLAQVQCPNDSSQCSPAASRFVGGVTESQLVQLGNYTNATATAATVLLDMRVDGGGPKRRTALSVDGGATFVEGNTPSEEGSQLPDAGGNMGSFVKSTASGSVYYSMTLSTEHDRTHMTVLQSHDDGASYTHGKLIYAGPSAYSDLVVFPGPPAARATPLGLAYERDIEGCSGESCSIVFERVPAELPKFEFPH
eukprot:g2663.t1